MINVIQQSAAFEDATPADLFEILMNADTHASLINAKVKISRKEGERFSAFNGMVTGKNHVIIPNRLIVQSWRGNVWNVEDPDSTLIMAFSATRGGAKIDLLHANVPVQFIKTEQWKELYWEPMRAYLKQRPAKRLSRPLGRTT